MRIINTVATLRQVLTTGAKSSKELQSMLGISQSSVSRLILEAKDQVVAVGAARSRRYALLDPLEGVGGRIQVCRIDEKGNVYPEAELYVLSQGQYAWKEHDKPSAKMLESLPYWIQNMRFEGFLGRSFAHRYASDFGVPKNLSQWSDRHMLRALSLLGEDTPGNVIVGHKSALRYISRARSMDVPVILSCDRGEAFNSLAMSALSGEPAGSSAGGEQPKFTAVVENEERPEWVMVKFAHAQTEEGIRWADLLICECIASEVMERAGIGAAKTEIVQHGDWTFLQSVRFDRVDMWGRVSLVSLFVIDAEFVGNNGSWVETGQALLNEGMMEDADFQKIQWLNAFGEYIGNTDRHLGNLSLFPKNERRFDLAPAYDMTPMFYRPKSGGILFADSIRPKAVGAPAEIDEAAIESAIHFWRRVEQDSRISEPFRAVCELNIDVLQMQARGPRMF